MQSGYRIADEPRPTAAARLAVDPVWPMLAVMLGGTWLSWPWFAFNAVAIGSASRTKELALAAGGFVLVIAATFGLFALDRRGLLSNTTAPYLGIVLVGVKLTVSYRLHLLQAKSFELYRYFGGAARNGVLLLVAGIAGRVSVLSGFDDFWRLVLT